jgi:hypothetical protein
MSDINLKINVEPSGADRFVIQITNAATGAITRTITGADPQGFTETDLRDTNGLLKCGLTEVQIEQAIAVANAKRVERHKE